jgi:hypothetical protein
LVKGPEGQILVEAKQMVDVRRYDIAIVLETKCRCSAGEAGKIEVIDLAYYGLRNRQ